MYKNPSLGRSESIITYGSIELTTEISGALYLDGKLMGNVSSNSKTPINEVRVGTHTVKIVGSETQTREITVYKDRATTVNFEKKKEDNSSVAGTFTDSRNGKAYKSVRIGNQVWMAENLDYSMPGSYVNVKGDRFYTWEAAMKACPAGWHLPSDKEWDILVNRFGGNRKAGAALKNKTGWEDGGNGTNSSGFTGLPEGYRGNGGAFNDIGKNGYFWSSTEKDDSVAWIRVLYYFNSEVNRYGSFEVNAYSCRCVQDN